MSERLTPRESQVLGEILAGRSNHEIGARLRIGIRTVETHRARIMEKIGARNVVDLVRIVVIDKAPKPLSGGDDEDQVDKFMAAYSEWFSKTCGRAGAVR